MIEKRIKQDYKNNSITTKLKKIITKTIIKLYTPFILIINLILIYCFKLTKNEIINFNIFLIICYLIINYLVTKIITRKLNQEILKEVESIKTCITKIKKGDFRRRIKLVHTEELNDIICFTNILLDKVEKSIECEKAKTLIDPLTNCYNRRALEINFDYILKKSLREKKTFGLVILDLDKFKKVNDKYGHNVGDKVLKYFAKIIQESVRNHDFVYRIGGEEFVIIFQNINKTKICKILKRLRQNVYYKILKNIKELEEPISVSGGYVLSKEYNLKEKHILSKMLNDADKLLYTAKKNGRNNIVG